MVYEKRDNMGRLETLQGKDLVDFITKNNLLEAYILIWNNDIELGTEPRIIEVDEDGDIILVQDHSRQNKNL